MFHTMWKIIEQAVNGPQQIENLFSLELSVGTWKRLYLLCLGSTALITPDSVKLILFKGWIHITFVCARCHQTLPKMTAGSGNAKHTLLEVQQRCFIIKTELLQINLGDASLMAPRQASGSIRFLRNNPPFGILTLLVIINLWHACDECW